MNDRLATLALSLGVGFLLALAAVLMFGCNTTPETNQSFAAEESLCDTYCGPHGDKLLICHVPPGDLEETHTLCVGSRLVPDHLEHGDYCGECEDEPEPEPDDGACDAPEDCTTCESDCGTCPPVCGDGICERENCETCPLDCGACSPVCGDGVCESGEDCENCAIDCGDCPPVCGDETCNGAETCETCPLDCGDCGPVCGDTLCEESETCSGCPADCGECPPVCGDGVCEGGEDCRTCRSDCGACPPVCGDDECEAGERCDTCASDCGRCSPVCGDGVCEESCEGCPQDCGVCVPTDSVDPGPVAPEPDRTFSGGKLLGCSTGGSISARGAFLLLGVCLLFAGHHLRKRKLFFAAAFAFVTAGFIYAAEAQNIGTERFEANADDNGVINIKGALLPPVDSFGFHFWLGYANDTLVIHENGSRTGNLVGDTVGGSLGAFFSPSYRLQLYLDLPYGGWMGPDLEGTQIGDPRVGAKFQLLDQEVHKLINVAIGGEATLPLASGDYLGERGTALSPYLALGADIESFRVGANLGYTLREQTQLEDLRVDDEIFARIGGTYGWERNQLGLSLNYTTSATGPINGGNRDYSELMLGYDRFYYDGLSSFVVTGVGLNEGYGAPDWRLLAGVRWAYTSPTPAPAPVCGALGGPQCIPETEPTPEPEPAPKPEPKPQKIPLLVETDVHFELGSAVVPPLYRPYLVEVAESVVEYHKVYPDAGFLVMVEGHTDAIDTQEYNLDLGERRALAVIQVLKENGVPLELVRMITKGKSDPRATNRTEAGRAMNRRVDVYLVEETPDTNHFHKRYFNDPAPELYDGRGELPQFE